MVLAWSGKEWANFLEALDGFVWPLVLLLGLYWFRPQVAALLSRIVSLDTPVGTAQFEPPDPAPVEDLRRQLPRETGASTEDEADASLDGGSERPQTTLVSAAN